MIQKETLYNAAYTNVAYFHVLKWHSGMNASHSVCVTKPFMSVLPCLAVAKRLATTLKQQKKSAVLREILATITQ